MGRSLRLFALAAVAAVWGCFSPPAADVLFACDPDDAPQCPPEYSCQSDGCCHRDGSDVEASRNACNSGAEAGFSATAASETDPITTDASSGGSSSDASSGGSSSAGSGSGSSGTTTSQAGTTVGSTGAASTSTGS